MTSTWDPTGDFAAVIDGAEPLTLVRQGTGATVAIAAAWRRADRASTDGATVTHEVTWEIAWNAAVDPPAVGDALRDAASTTWTVVSVERLQVATRWQCTGRRTV